MLKRLGKSFVYAFRGLWRVFREERNLQVQLLFAIITIALAVFLEIKPMEWCVVIIVIVLVLLMEIVNSAIERIADTLKPRIHEYVKNVKDIMAAAVMLSSILAIVVGLIVFLPYFLR